MTSGIKVKLIYIMYMYECMNDIYVTVYGVKQENGIKILKSKSLFFCLFLLDTIKVILPIKVH